jgi:sulfate adenylyltransferase subunit 2
MNVWHYIRREGIELPSLYFAAPRQVIWRSGSWLPVSDFISLRAGEVPTTKTIRFRTLGDITITGGIESEAASLDAVITEVETLRQTERGNREDDKRSESSMEERKKQGYF